ncbi:unnamed protein product [Didymodactylos carnosus]|nr:unnamed protein product [Didymodactylos carnosus]CAF3653204.1 unnamed protein product [Didymodactylos carnosus]
MSSQRKLDQFFIKKKLIQSTEIVTTTIEKDESNSGCSESLLSGKRSNEIENDNVPIKRTRIGSEQEEVSNDTMDMSQIINSYKPLNEFYLEKFLIILTSVQKHHRQLFNETELELFTKLELLPASSQIIFIRLLMRRCKWIRLSGIKYERSSSDDPTVNYLTPLVENNLLSDSTSFNNLEDGLNLLTSNEMKEFSKRFHCSSKTKSKKSSIENLKNLTNQYKSLFSNGDTQSTNRDHLLLKELSDSVRKLKRVIGQCYKVSEDVRAIFFRMMLAHHPCALLSMDELDQNAFTLLFKSLQITRGDLRLPWRDEDVNHDYSPFKTTEQLKR